MSKKGKHIKTNKFLSDENKKYFLLNKHVRVQFNHTKAHTMLVAVASFYGKSVIVYCYQCKAMFGNFTCLVLGLTVIAGSLIYPVWRALRANKHCLLLIAMFIRVEKCGKGLPHGRIRCTPVRQETNTDYTGAWAKCEYVRLQHQSMRAHNSHSTR